MANHKKVASLYLASKNEFTHLANQISKVLDDLQDVVYVMDARHGEPSLADTYTVVSNISRDIRMDVSKRLALHEKALRVLAKQTRR